MNIFIYIIAIASLVAFILFALDKLFSKMGTWRIPESLLLWIALCGGAAGALAAMVMFHHKTCKLWFTIGIPLMQIVHIAILVMLLYL
ncbi:MAG: DUF1294 domain-containing protein [Bacteroidaceae bacterium]|nr:DUF1294 domain-containing protein [Bacteroidaceae bacterium]